MSIQVGKYWNIIQYAFLGTYIKELKRGSNAEMGYFDRQGRGGSCPAPATKRRAEEGYGYSAQLQLGRRTRKAKIAKHALTPEPRSFLQSLL